MVTQDEKTRAIAEKVMGWTWCVTGHPCYPLGAWFNDDAGTGTPRVCFEPFDDPIAMVDVMEKMRLASKRPVLNCYMSGYQCELCVGWGGPGNPAGLVYGSGPTPMHAVAEAAYRWAISSSVVE